MFGGRRRRIAKLSAGAEKHLEPGETIHEIVQTQTGDSAAANARAVGTSEFLTAQTGMVHRTRVNAAPHVLLATNRHLYAMTLSGARLLDVGYVVLKLPLDEVELRHERNRLIVGGETFHVMALFGDHATRLADYVATRSSRS
jgi:hypothetical protein